MPSRCFSSTISRRAFLAVCGGTTLLGSTLSGCGGSKKSGSSLSPTRARGTANLTIYWPDSAATDGSTSRLIPSTTSALLLRATQTGPSGSLIFDRYFGPITRPTDAGQVSEITLDDLPPGNVVVAASAFPAAGSDTPPAALAFGQTVLAITAGQTTEFTITLESAIAGFRFVLNGGELASDTRPSFQVGDVVNFAAVPIDSSGAQVLISQANMEWQTPSAMLGLGLNNDGTVRVGAVAASQTTGEGEILSVRDRESGQSAALRVFVKAQYRADVLPPGQWRAVNAQGIVCGQAEFGGRQTAALFKAGELVDLGFSDWSVAVDVNNNGQVLVNDDSGIAVWQDGHSTRLPWFSTELRVYPSAVALNDAGQILGKDTFRIIIDNSVNNTAYRDGEYFVTRGWIWSEGSFVSFGQQSLGGPNSFTPVGISNTGQVVGYEEKVIPDRQQLPINLTKHYNYWADTQMGGVGVEFAKTFSPRSYIWITCISTDGVIYGYHNPTLPFSEFARAFSGNYQQSTEPLVPSGLMACKPVAAKGPFVVGNALTAFINIGDSIPPATNPGCRAPYYGRRVMRAVSMHFCHPTRVFF